MKKTPKKLHNQSNLEQIYKVLNQYPSLTDRDRQFARLLIESAYLCGKIEVREEYAKSLRGGEK